MCWSVKMKSLRLFKSRLQTLVLRPTRKFHLYLTHIRAQSGVLWLLKSIKSWLTHNHNMTCTNLIFFHLELYCLHLFSEDFHSSLRLPRTLITVSFHKRTMMVSGKCMNKRFLDLRNQKEAWLKILNKSSFEWCKRMPASVQLFRTF